MKLQKIQDDDPRLLQYVLKEISMADSQIVETAIKNQPEIAAEIQELKRLYGDIAAVETEPQKLELSADRKKALFAQTIYKKTESGGFGFRNWSYAAGGLMAACFGFLIFNHSLKNEVKPTASYERPTIPADSEMAAAPSSPPVETQVAARAQPAQQQPESGSAGFGGPAKDKIAISKAPEVADDRERERKVQRSQFAASKESAPLEVAAQPPAAETESINAAAAEKTRPLISAFRNDELENRGESDLADAPAKIVLSAKGGAVEHNEVYKKKIAVGVADSVEEKVLPSAKNFVITADGLNYTDASKLKYQFELCRIKYGTQRDIKMNYHSQNQLMEFDPPQLTGTESQLVTCIQTHLRQALPKEIKTIQIELKSVSKQDKINY